MNKSILMAVGALMLAAPVRVAADAGQPPLSRQVFSEGLRFCEGTLPYRQMILISNFGGEELDPLNNAGRGYIAAIDTGAENMKVKVFIPNDGYLSAPKGMAVHGSRLFIADVNRVVVYNLRNLKEAPVTIRFPEGDDFVNDIVVISDIILVSVTNTGRIYGIDASDDSKLAGAVPKLMGEIPGANGMVVDGGMLYVASYNPSGTPTADNVIYSNDMSVPGSKFKKLDANIKPGQYDGIAISKDSRKLYFTSWNSGDNPSMIYIDLVARQPVGSLNVGVEFKGPADISIKGGYLWLPDLPDSKVYAFPLNL